MKMADGNAWVVHWRQFAVDSLIGAATLAVAFAAIGSLWDLPPTLLISGALVGIALILESNVTAQPTTDNGRQSLQLPTESESVRPKAQPVEPFDPAIADATSV